MEREYISVTDTAKLIRIVLKESFPGVKFSVKSSKYSGGASINIHYTDGPAPDLVDHAVDCFSGSYFDGMIDYQGSVYATLDDKPVRFGADFIFSNQKHSETNILYGVWAFIDDWAKTGKSLINTPVADWGPATLCDYFKRGLLMNEYLTGVPSRDVHRLIHECIREVSAVPCCDSKTRDRVQVTHSDGYGSTSLPNEDGQTATGYPELNRGTP